jgi:hypothetical protein
MDVYSSDNPRALSGGMKVVPVLKIASVPCRIQDESAGQEIMADGKTIKISHLIFTAYTGMVNGDTVVETSPGSEGRRFRYLGPKTRRAIGNIPAFTVLLFQEMQN